jgi:hypothetical protein
MLLIPTPPLTKRNREAVKVDNVGHARNCTLYESFSPNPGGQTEFFSLLDINSPDDIDYRWVAFVGGIGSGKSWSAAVWFCSRALKFPEARGLISACDYPQLEASTLVCLAEVCEAYNIPLYPNLGTPDETARAIANRKNCRIGDCWVLCISATKFGGATAKSKQSGRGMQLRFAWIDEGAYIDQVAFETINGRLGRGKGTLKGIGVISTTPNRNQPYNWLYDHFDDPDRDESKVNLYKSFHAHTKDNPHLDSDYVQSLEASYTPELAIVELAGGYASTSTGRVFKHWERSRNALTRSDEVRDFGYNPKRPLWASFDYNWHPATCLLAQPLDPFAPRDEIELVIVGEIYIEQSDTYELAETFVEWLATHQQQGEIKITGDASGNQKTANSKKTNWAIVKDTLNAAQVRYTTTIPKANPNVKDTVNAVNSLFYHSRMFVVLGKCGELVKDLESMQWDDNGNLDKKADPKRSHLGDCLRYMAWNLVGFSKRHKASAGS